MINTSSGKRFPGASVAEVKNYGLKGVHRTLQLGKQGPVLVGNADTDSFTVTLQDASTLTTMGGANATSGAHFITKSQLDSVYTEATFLANVNYNDSNPILLGNITSGTKTIITTLTIGTAFNNANAVVTIGTSANANLLMSDNYCEIEVAGVYQTVNIVEFASNTALNIYVTQGGASAGAGNVLVSVVDGPVVDGGTINYGAGGGGIALGDLSVTSNSPSGNGSLTYNNSTGVFTFTPADANAGGIGLTALSVTSNSPSGNGSLTYSNTTGVFTFTPANLSSVAGNYGNSNVTTLLSSFGSNTILTTGNITGGNLLTSAEVIASGVIQSGTGLSTGGYLSVDGSTDLHNTTVTGNLSATGNVSAGNVIAQNFSGNISITGNVTGTSPNVTLVAGAYSTTFDNTGNTTFANGTVSLTTLTATGNITGNFFIGNGSQLTGIVTTAIQSGTANVRTFSSANVTISASGNANVLVVTGTGANISGTANVSGNLSAGNVSATTFTGALTGNVTGSATTAGTVTTAAQPNITSVGTLTSLGVTGNISAGNISTAGQVSASGNVSVGGNLTVTGNITGNVATTFEGAWTVPTGNSTQSFTVTSSNTYYMWVDCNIPNGILVWNATGTVTNTNVPVVGYQYAWVYNGGGTPIDFTSIPNQFVGTANTIVRSSVSPSATTNRFDFGINNTSGGNVTVRYGWAQIS